MKSRGFSRWVAWILFGLTLLAYDGIVTAILNGCYHYLALEDPVPAQAYGGFVIVRTKPGRQGNDAAGAGNCLA